MEWKRIHKNFFVFRKQAVRVVGRIHVANDRSQFLTLVNKVTNLRLVS